MMRICQEYRKGIIDLHMHSTASDGTDNAEELLQRVREAGISVFSVTDHDTIEGTMRMETIVPEEMKFIIGIEFSSITEAGKCHILGYGCDWNKRAFRNILEEGTEKRRNKLNRRISFLRDEFGIKLDEKDIAILRSNNSVGKPHLGNLLVSMGFASDKNEVIVKYIDPCKTETDRIDGEKVIQAILLSGGVPVWAHPLGGTDEREVPVLAFERQLDVLISAGLMGLECYYSKYTKLQVDMLIEAARKHDLCISGGSDYHGRNKKVRLGELNVHGFLVTEDMLTVVEAVQEKLAKRNSAPISMKSTNKNEKIQG